MTKFFVNISNHPSDKWDEKQRIAALEYGSIVDMPFPAIEATCDINVITALADEYLFKVKQLSPPSNVTIHIMGEQTFCFSLLIRLQKAGYKCVASTTRRSVQELSNNERRIVFNFESFRDYERYQ